MTRMAVIASSILSEPLITLYGLLAFILRKDLHATAFQIAVFMMLKPVVSIFSLYWSHTISKRPDRLLANVIWAGILSRLPFLFFPLIENVWLLIACSALHMLFVRGGGPAWMEILKLNLKSDERNKIFSIGSSLGYLEGILLAAAVGFLLDQHQDLWRWLFPLSALLGIFGVCLQARVPICLKNVPLNRYDEGSSFWEVIVAPWQNAWDLMLRRPDFFHFQMGFMLCGFGLMLIQPALPILFSDVLKLSYTEVMVALSIFRGVGFASTSGIWARLIGTLNIYRFSSLVFFLLVFYALSLMMAYTHAYWIYASYFIYGVVLSGNHLSWHLSGPIFAKEEDSSLFSSVNVVTVGIRGCVGPPMGGLLCTVFGPFYTLAIGAVLFALAGIKMQQWAKPQAFATSNE